MRRPGNRRTWVTICVAMVACLSVARFAPAAEAQTDPAQAIRMMRDGLAELDSEVFRRGARFLAETLPAHNSREEHVLYPTMDQLLNDNERRTLSEVGSASSPSARPGPPSE